MDSDLGNLQFLGTGRQRVHNAYDKLVFGKNVLSTALGQSQRFARRRTFTLVSVNSLGTMLHATLPEPQSGCLDSRTGGKVNPQLQRHEISWHREQVGTPPLLSTLVLHRCWHVSNSEQRCLPEASERYMTFGPSLNPGKPGLPAARLPCR